MQLATAAAPKPQSSILSRATGGRIRQPYRVLIYGPEKVGKSTFGNDAPEPAHLDIEDGTSEIDVKEGSRIPIYTWEEYVTALQELLDVDHGRKTLITDSVTKLETLASRVVCAQGKRKSLAEFAHGRGYTAMYSLFDEAMTLIERLHREKGMNVIMVAHSKIETFRNPEGDDFDRYSIELSRHIAGVLKKWAHAILFAKFETLVDSEKNEKHGKGVGGRTRQLACIGCDAYEAGNRYSLPEFLELSWSAFDVAARDGEEKERRIVADINEAMLSLPEEKQALAHKSVEACKGDAAKLNQTLNWVLSQIKKENDQ